MLAAQVDQDVDRLWAMVEADPATEVTVDLEAREVRAGDVAAPYHIDEYTRWRLLEGLDDIGITLSHEDDITAYEATRLPWKPATLEMLHIAFIEGANHASETPPQLPARVKPRRIHSPLTFHTPAPGKRAGRRRFVRFAWVADAENLPTYCPRPSP